MLKDYSFLKGGYFLLIIQILCIQSAKSQSNKLRVRHFLPDSIYVEKNVQNLGIRHIAYYATIKSPALPKVETVIITNQTDQKSETITRTTTTPVKPGELTKKRVLYRKKFNPQKISFFVEHKKDTLFLVPIAQQDTTDASLSDDERFFYRTIKRVTFFIPIDKQYNYTTLRFKMKEFGVMLVPFRVYAGKELQPSISGGGAVYYGWTHGTRYYYNGGTSTALSHLWGVYMGFTKVDVTPKNSDNGVTEKTTEPALTLGGTYLFGREEFKAGPVLGIDIPLTGPGNKWNYAFHPYVGISLSLSFSAFTL